MKKLKKIIPYIFLFIFIILVNMFLVHNNMDEIWNYGFSLAIRMGEIPYNDFNMVVPPFYPILMSLPLFVFKNYLSFVILHSLFMTLAFYLAIKMYKDRGLYLLLVVIVFFNCIYPTYNTFLSMLLILILYLENSKIKHKDLLIGIIVGLSFLTKQSVGILLLIPWLIKIKDINIKKRIIGFIIPNIICLLYLVICGNLYNFIDQCFLGLIDFSGNAKNYNIISITLFIIVLIFSLIICKKKGFTINNLYILICYSIFIPTFDILHFYYVLFYFTLLIISNYEFNRINNKFIFTCLFIGVVSITTFNRFNNDLGKFPNDFKNFNYKYYPSIGIKYITTVNKYVDSNTILYDDTAYLYRVINDQKIGYLDLVNHGNLGYHSSEKIIKLLKENKDKKILINNGTGKRIKNHTSQLDRDGYLYIIKHYKKTGEVLDFSIYEYNK